MAKETYVNGNRLGESEFVDDNAVVVYSEPSIEEAFEKARKDYRPILSANEEFFDGIDKIKEYSEIFDKKYSVIIDKKYSEIFYKKNKLEMIIKSKFDHINYINEMKPKKYDKDSENNFIEKI